VVKNSAQVSAALDEVKGLFHVVCRELDSLSHFHYTPRPVVAEPVVTGLPSISLEEVLPSAENHGSTSAPEQVLEKKSGRAAALLTEEELGRDDRQRLRRASKAVRRKQRKLDESEEKLIAKINPGAGNKYEAKKALEEIRGDKRVVQGRTEGNKGFGKSSDFFSDMQQQAQIDIAAKKEGFVKKQKQAPTNDTGLSKKLKL
jgi:U3 small nucleolar RNA-associated protein MPP10